MRVLVLALAAVAAAAGCTGPSTRQRSNEPPPPAGKVAELEFFVGHWHAEIENPLNGQKAELDYTVRPDVGGHWYEGRGSVPAMGMEIRDFWGKDPQTGEIVRSIFDSTGTFGLARSKGWNGETMIFEGEASSPTGKLPVRETILRMGPDAFDAEWQALIGGNWTTYSVEKLRRIRR